MVKKISSVWCGLIMFGVFDMHVYPKCINQTHKKEIEFKDQTGATLKTTGYSCVFRADDAGRFDKDKEQSCYRCGCPRSEHDNRDA